VNELSDILFPKSCCICKKKGSYLCNYCKKLFKRSLPECYICRKISPDYNTHYKCKEKGNERSLDRVFVAWEYNSLSSILLKKYKYNYVSSIEDTLSDFFIESIRNSTFDKNLRDTLLTNVPLARRRLKERGFNQTTEIARKVAKAFNVSFTESLLKRTDMYGHQSLRDKDERKGLTEKTFLFNKEMPMTGYKSITILDDVITTGATLEAMSIVIRREMRKDIEINGLCLFRGKPYYLEIS
jgi:ComF family protein